MCFLVQSNFLVLLFFSFFYLGKFLPLRRHVYIGVKMNENRLKILRVKLFSEHYFKVKAQSLQIWRRQSRTAFLYLEILSAFLHPCRNCNFHPCTEHQNRGNCWEISLTHKKTLSLTVRSFFILKSIDHKWIFSVQYVMIIFIRPFGSLFQGDGGCWDRIRNEHPNGSNPVAELAGRARICKHLRSPGIDSEEWIPPGYST